MTAAALNLYNRRPTAPEKQQRSIAAPIFDDHGHFAAALGVSVTPHVFDVERRPLAEIVKDLAMRTGSAVPATRRYPQPVR